MMLDGVMLLWFILTALSLIFVSWDIRSTPANHLKHGMMTVRPPEAGEPAMAGHADPMAGHQQEGVEHMTDMGAAATLSGHGGMAAPTVSPGAIVLMTILTFALLAAGLGVVAVFGGR